MDADRQAWQDERAVQAICVRYATALDDRDWEQLRRCFTPDAVVVYEGIAECTGYEAVEARCRSALAPFARTQHLIGNVVVDLDGDLAGASCYVQAQHVRAGAEGAVNVTLVGRYRDEFVRGDDGWRIRRRHLETWWTARGPAVL
ncbi:MAG: hypothetical protein JWL64_1927 [Frankiales bacterium]|nr:hypothetical protein [Frankiales bacterium]